mmetsp:Transcript_13396/g.34167  ORF Transcript_13396/g.34167 Transcript_13396/m.34167 type:complete len:242 (-) Transcript_13396:83-808(-)
MRPTAAWRETGPHPSRACSTGRHWCAGSPIPPLPHAAAPSPGTRVAPTTRTAAGAAGVAGAVRTPGRPAGRPSAAPQSRSQWRQSGGAWGRGWWSPRAQGSRRAWLQRMPRVCCRARPGSARGSRQMHWPPSGKHTPHRPHQGARTGSAGRSAALCRQVWCRCYTPWPQPPSEKSRSGTSASPPKLSPVCSSWSTLPAGEAGCVSSAQPDLRCAACPASRVRRSSMRKTCGAGATQSRGRW